MLRNLISFLLLLTTFQLFAQKNINIPLANDFTVITSNNDTLSLYKTLNEGKTVVLDLFQITCGPCQTNTPIIDSAYKLHGSGQNNVVFWGISNADSNQDINEFCNTYHVSFPCAGIEGGGDSLINMLYNQLGYFGFPAYAVICPADRTMHWQVNSQPTYTGFDNYINSCNTIGINKKESKEDKMIQIFPNPATEFVNIKINTDEVARFRIELLSNMGEKLKTQYFNSDQGNHNQFRLDLDGIKEGSYYLTVYQDGNLIYAGLLMKLNSK